ncbi:META domain-containing protein [Desulfovibrio sp. OttesenSCG-928-G11]|nr:META domain-containing protein [Desulfovibrio sp. OttesenSCG-928-G11]
MKETIYLCILTALFAFGLGGCSADSLPLEREANASQQEKTDGGSALAAQKTPEDLLDRHFVLLSVNGVDFSGKERIPELEFGEDMRIAGGICNRFAGKARLEDGVLLAGRLALTRMLCVDEELNKLEQRFTRMLEQGASLSFDGKTLILEGAELTLVFRRSDLER